MGKKQGKLVQEKFSLLSIRMLASRARWVLGVTERRILDFLEVELQKHDRKNNGDLVLTYEQLVDLGMDRASIAPALRVLERLGFIRIQHGRGGNADHHEPNKIFLTYVYTTRANLPTHDWKKFETKEDAEQAAKEARAAKNARFVAMGQKYNPKRRRLNPKTDQFKNVIPMIVPNMEKGTGGELGGDWFSRRIIPEPIVIDEPDDEPRVAS